MEIDLKSYATELGHWVGAFEDFVDHTSKFALPRLQRKLEEGRDNGRSDHFIWELASPIRTKPTKKYDGENREVPEVFVEWGFHSRFQKKAPSRKNYIWIVEQMVTHIRVFLACDKRELMHFHHDLKNSKQLGPCVHMQFSEQFMEQSTGVRLAVPRFPCAALLPTDCLDYILAEFFTSDWSRAQENSVGRTTLKAQQNTRIVAMANAIMKELTASRLTPLTALQDCFISGCRLY